MTNLPSTYLQIADDVNSQALFYLVPKLFAVSEDKNVFGENRRLLERFFIVRTDFLKFDTLFIILHEIRSMRSRAEVDIIVKSTCRLRCIRLNFNSVKTNFLGVNRHKLLTCRPYLAHRRFSSYPCS